MKYTDRLKVGAVYQGTTPSLQRRITRIERGIVEYVFYQSTARTVPRCIVLEEMFREFTLCEIPPSEVKR